MNAQFSRRLLLVSILAISASNTASGDEPMVTQTELLVPMRDGIRLKTIVFRQASAAERLPVLLLRTPYNQTKFAEQAARVARHGYVAITQDCRGRFGSEGTFAFYWGEGPDGFDTVEMIRNQPWSDGQVGMWGPSYMGSVQWLTAAEGTPLTVLAPTASAANFYYNLYLGGAYLLPHAKTGFCIDLFGPPTNLGSSSEWPRWYMSLPLTDWDKIIGRTVPWQMAMIRHYRPDGFWRRADASTEIPRMNFPAQHIVGYYDFMCRESVRSYQGMVAQSASRESRQSQQLVLGPWDHATGQRKAGEIDFGADAQLDVLDENLKWFDRFLKPANPATAQFPKVRYFSMGDNKWFETETWPPSAARPTSYYFHSSGHANSRNGDGRLDTHAPAADEPIDTFRSDPADPVPAWPSFGNQYRDIWGPVDQRLAQDRRDVLVYATPPLRHAMRFAGTVVAKLWVSTDTRDADWVVKLIDVRPDGFCHPLASGVRRGTARDSELDRQPLEPGKKYLLTIDVGHAAALVQEEHRLAVQIAGSNFPNYDRNLHTAEGPEGSKTLVANENVWHNPDEPSLVILPIIE